MPRRKKDPDMPKRPLSSYMFYSKERRPKLQEEKPSLAFGEYSKLIAAEWKEMDSETKQPFVEMSKKDKERYENELKDYKEKKKNEPPPPIHYPMEHMGKNFTTEENIEAHRRQNMRPHGQYSDPHYQYYMRQRGLMPSYQGFNPYMMQNPEIAQQHATQQKMPPHYYMQNQAAYRYPYMQQGHPSQMHQYRAQQAAAKETHQQQVGGQGHQVGLGVPGLRSDFQQQQQQQERGKSPSNQVAGYPSQFQARHSGTGGSQNQYMFNNQGLHAHHQQQVQQFHHHQQQQQAQSSFHQQQAPGLPEHPVSDSVGFDDANKMTFGNERIGEGQEPAIPDESEQKKENDVVGQVQAPHMTSGFGDPQLNQVQQHLPSNTEGQLPQAGGQQPVHHEAPQQMGDGQEQGNVAADEYPAEVQSGEPAKVPPV